VVVAFFIIGRKKCKTGSFVVCFCTASIPADAWGVFFELCLSGFKRSFNLWFCGAFDVEFRLAA
jgi:hypothetical protein